jgi:DNA-binding PadR family transcriptional regulator
VARLRRPTVQTPRARGTHRRDDDAPLGLLDTIAEQPRHGYELIRVFGERAGSEYRPLPGSVYPRLAKLADDGLITGIRTGRRVVYTITERGQQQVTAPTATTDHGSEDRATLLGRDNDVLEAAQRAVTDFARDVKGDIAAHDTRVLGLYKAELECA